MKVSVVINAEGEILAMGPPDGEIADREEGGPTHHAFIPREGQTVVTAELPDELATEEQVMRLFDTHRVEMRDAEAAFVERPSS